MNNIKQKTIIKKLIKQTIKDCRFKIDDIKSVINLNMYIEQIEYEKKQLKKYQNLIKQYEEILEEL